MVLVEISIGELFDKISILEIKSDRISDPEKLVNVNSELSVLGKAASEIRPPDDLLSALRKTNEALWDIEDRIRILESKKEFGEEFVELARAVYHTNDERSRLKREINLACGSRLVEEKSYEEY